MRAVVQEGKDGQFYARFVADNGETWFTSEGYTRRGDAQRSVLDFYRAVTERKFGEGVVNLDVNGDPV